MLDFDEETFRNVALEVYTLTEKLAEVADFIADILRCCSKTA